MSDLSFGKTWPLRRLAEGVELLAKSAGLAWRHNYTRPSIEGVSESDVYAIGQVVGAVATSLGFEAEGLDGAAEVTFAQTLASLPAVIRIPNKDGFAFLLVESRRAKQLRLLDSDGRTVKIPEEQLLDLLTASQLTNATAEIQKIVADAAVPLHRQKRVCRHLLREEQALAWMEGVWSLRMSPGESVGKLARSTAIPQKVAGLVVAHTLQSVLWIVSWWIIGNAVLGGRLETGWLWAWALLLATIIPLRLWVSWSQGKVSILAGSLLKRRLLFGAMQLNPDDIRKLGSGQLLGGVNESESMESLALAGGFSALLAIVEVVGATIVLGLGASGGWHALTLIVWVAITLMTGHRFLTTLRKWSQQRIDMTDDLVEKMVGHRTRLIQEPAERRHDGEDQALESYLLQSRELDKRLAKLVTFLPRGWLVVGSIGVVWPFVAGMGTLPTVAVAAGGVFLGYQALSKLAGGLLNLGEARVSWNAIATMFNAGARLEELGATQIGKENGISDIILEANDIWFSHQGRPDAVLRGCSLQVRRGDQILLEGASGSGKSTLGAVLAGLREPSSGLVLARGLDLHTLGMSGWRQRVQAAPQFHDNYIFTGTFLFNVLMGRRWPPSYAIDQVTTICYELGLGPLIERMPGGLMQLVGESGWQLSHGEKSRVFLARALIQGADLIELDESFAALDPETLRSCLACAQNRATALLVIAHP